MKALLIICAVNEGVKLESAALRLSAALKERKAGPQVEVLIVDDGSTDGVPEKVCREHGFHYLRNATQRGVGFGIKMAYQYGLDHGFVILATMAGNNKDEPKELDRILGPIAENRADFVQGSRYLKGGRYGEMPFYRLLATRIMHPLLFSIISGKRITDSTNGFRALRTTFLRDARMDWHQEWLDQYELEPYLFYQAIKLGYRVEEAPVSKIYPDKKLGYSKMKPVTGWWSILKPLFYLAFKVKK